MNSYICRTGKDRFLTESTETTEKIRSHMNFFVFPVNSVVSV